MILYRIKRADTTVDWERTQAEAKANVKRRDQEAAGMTMFGHSYEQEEVPTDSHGLHAWLKVNALGEKKVKQSAETPHHP